MPSESSTPSWIFSYLPNPKPTTTSRPTPATTSTTTPSSTSTPTFLTSLHKALFTPKLDPDQERIATLQGVKTSLEQQIAFRQKAGLSTKDLEREQMGKIDAALRGLTGEKRE